MFKNKKLINKLKPFWKRMELERSAYFEKLQQIELEMEKITKIKGIEFF
jgi:hypothetical protein